MNKHSDLMGLSLGAFLRDRRSKLDPEALGFARGRRRTPGLRREEVALLADISADWYTWLEQGRGGRPSADVLDRLAKGLHLNGVEREHLFLLAQGHQADPEEAPDVAVSPILQRMLNRLGLCPAYIRDAAWDIVAWNQTLEILWRPTVGEAPAGSRLNALAMFFDYAKDPTHEEWRVTARNLVAIFRGAMLKSGAGLRARQLVKELSARNAVFCSLWEESGVAQRGVTAKKIDLVGFGSFKFDYAEFRVEGQQELTMVIFSPASAQDEARIRAIVDLGIG